MINNIRFSQISGGNGTKLLSMGPGPEGVFFNGPITEGVVDLGYSGTSKTFSLNDGTVFKCILGSDCTFNMPNPLAGRSFTLFLTQNGAYTATFSGVSWPAGSAPTITTGNGKKDILVFVSDGTCWYGNYVQNYSCVVTPTSSSSSSDSSSSSSGDSSSSSSSGENFPATIYVCGSTGSLVDGTYTLDSNTIVEGKPIYLDSNNNPAIQWTGDIGGGWIQYGAIGSYNPSRFSSNIIGIWYDNVTNISFAVLDVACDSLPNTVYFCGTSQDNFFNPIIKQSNTLYLCGNGDTISWDADNNRWKYDYDNMYSLTSNLLGLWTDNTQSPSVTFIVQNSSCE